MKDIYYSMGRISKAVDDSINIINTKKTVDTHLIETLELAFEQAELTKKLHLSAYKGFKNGFVDEEAKNYTQQKHEESLIKLAIYAENILRSLKIQQEEQTA